MRKGWFGEILLVAKSAHRGLAEAGRTLAGPHRRTGEQGKGLADLGRGVPRGQDPLVRDPHVREDLAEQGLVVTDTHGSNDVRFCHEHVVDQRGDARRVVTHRMLVLPVADDQSDRPTGHAVLSELLSLGQDRGQDDRGLVVERGPLVRVVVARVHALGILDRTVGVEDVTVQVAGVQEHALTLLGTVEDFLDDQIVTVTQDLGVTGKADRPGVVGHHGDEQHLAGVDIVDVHPETGFDLSTDVVQVQGEHRGRGNHSLFRSGGQEFVDVGGITHFGFPFGCLSELGPGPEDPEPALVTSTG